MLDKISLKFRNFCHTTKLNLLNTQIGAFTLSEVLITLGIIAVVAAMTLPVLNNMVQDVQYKAAYKKAYSVASQAVMNANQKEEFVYANGKGDYANQKTNFLVFMNQFKVAKKCINNNNQECWNPIGEKFYNGVYPIQGCLAFVDNSGMAWSMFYAGEFIIFVDTNGFKKPNQIGKDRFLLYPGSEISINSTGIPSKIIVPEDNSWWCQTRLKCATERNYYSRSWLYN